jgi:predicted CXXCH cytochrome family protein
VSETLKYATTSASRARSPGVVTVFGLLGIVILLGGCTDETVIFKERELFDAPPDTVNNFLGYFDLEAKMTVCGNCHVGKQTTWEETAHAGAWETLQESGHAQALCEGCHTISQNGNVLVDPAGYNLVPDDRYHDVQCESCHGPGLEHVLIPDAPGNQPLASALVGSDLTNGCGDCHQGTHHGFVDEWEQSPHAEVVAYPAGREECQGCHRGQQVMERFGENANYIEKDSPEHLAIVCAVCHDPHDATNEHQLRKPVDTNSIEEHLCAQCHRRRTNPDPTSTHGLEPHAPEGDLLVGDAGWFPPGANIDQGQIRGTHGTERNAELCATCHLPTFDVTDPATGDHVFTVTGHLFRPIPCLDAQGVPEPFEDSCELSTTARTFEACTASGCHGDQEAAFSALTAATTRIQKAADELYAQLQTVDPNLDDAGGFIDPTDPTFTVAEGAFFNYHLATFGQTGFGTNTVVGSSVHNPFLVEALLIASQQAVQDEYGVSPAPNGGPIDYAARIQAVLRRAGN